MERIDGAIPDHSRATATGGPLRWDKAAVVEALRRRCAQGSELNNRAIRKSDPRLARAVQTHFGSHDEALRAAGVDPASARKCVAWDKARVVEALRQRHSRGEPMHVAAIERSDVPLTGAIRRHFGSHEAALRAAGIDPPVVERPRFWSQAKVIEALRTRAAAGLKMNVKAIRNSDPPLAGAMNRCFGSSEAALRAAGIDPAEVAKQRSWDRPMILARLRDRLARGRPLNNKAVQKADAGLATAIRNHFGSHDQALHEIGVEPATVRRKVFWDRQKIVDALRDRIARGLEVNQAAVAQSDASLNSAIVNHFGAHDDALRAAGIDPATVRKRAVPLDRAAVIASLRERSAMGLDVNRTGVQLSNAGLHTAIRNHFPSHDAALAAAGIDPAAARKTSLWDKPRIIEALRRHHACGDAVNSAAIQQSDPRLSGAIFRHFEGHDAALRAAGIDPPVEGRTRWSQATVVEALRTRAAAGLEMNPYAIRKSDTPLGNAMSYYFGSCEDALRAAGIDPAAAAKHRSWDRATVLARLRERLAAGLPLNRRAIEKSDTGFAQAIMRYFVSHDAALRAAGIDPESVRLKRPPWSEGEILAELRSLAEDGVVPSPLSKFADTAFAKATRRHFGSEEAAAAAAGLSYERPPACEGLGHWTEELVLQTLCDLHREGHDLRYRPMKERSQPLFFAAKHFFGSYVNAVRQAGINYWDMSQAQLAKERTAARPDQDRQGAVADE